MSGAAGTASTAAAAERQRRMCEEEEEMTPYSAPELAQDWEFKILRSSLGSFRSPVYLRQVLDAEARAGWLLVEKFDNSRIRLKRPAQARDLDGKLDFDPYRSYAGASQTTVALATILILVALFAVVAAMVAA